MDWTEGHVIHWKFDFSLILTVKQIDRISIDIAWKIIVIQLEMIQTKSDKSYNSQRVLGIIDSISVMDIVVNCPVQQKILHAEVV